MALNKPGFKYGRTGWTALNSTKNVVAINHPDLGFVSLYSKSSINEGKAELYSSLFVEDSFKKLNKWIKQDKYLKKKVFYMKLFLEHIDNKINAQYWNELHK